MSRFELGIVAVLAALVLLRAVVVMVFAIAIIRPVRSCPACFRSTVAIHVPWLALLARTFEWRWCPHCRWAGLGRRTREPTAPPQRNRILQYFRKPG